MRCVLRTRAAVRAAERSRRTCRAVGWAGVVLIAAATLACETGRLPDVGYAGMDVADAPAADASDLDGASLPSGPPTSFRGHPLSSPDHGLRGVDAIGYEVDLRADDLTPGSETFAATTTGTFVALEALSAVDLDFARNTIDAVYSNGVVSTHSRNGDVLTVALATPVRAGDAFTVTVRYHGPFVQLESSGGFNVNGGLLVRQRTRTGHRMFFSLDWPTRTRRWIPVRDHPRDGAMFALRATFPEALTVVSNGRRVATNDNGDGTRTWQYEALTAMPVYDFHVAVSDGWTETPAGATASGVPIRHYDYTADTARALPAFRDMQLAMDFYERSFGTYRWGLVAFLEEPLVGGGMEHATVVSLDDSLFLAPEQARLVAIHELAHHWSGNLVRIHGWNDFWLSEGFADYLTVRFVQQNDGAAAAAALWRTTLSRALGVEVGGSSHALRPPDPEVDVLTIFDAISYKKGAFVLRMLERAMGEAAFTDALRQWFDQHAFDSVSTTDLQRHLETAAGRSLAWLFDPWVYGSGFPALDVHWTYDTVSHGVDVTIAQRQTFGPSGGFHAPVEIDFGMAASHQRATIDLTGLTTTAHVAVPFQPDTIVVDPDEVLYAVVSCDAARPCRAGYRCQALGAIPGTVCVP